MLVKDRVLLVFEVFSKRVKDDIVSCRLRLFVSVVICEILIRLPSPKLPQQRFRETFWCITALVLEGACVPQRWKLSVFVIEADGLQSVNCFCNCFRGQLFCRNFGPKLRNKPT